MSGPVFVLGGHQTDFAKVWSRAGQDISDMMRESIQGAVADARIAWTDIGVAHVGNAFAELCRQQAHLGALVAQVAPELWGVPAMRHEGACASSSLATLVAMAELEAGRYDCALVLGVEEEKNLPGDDASRAQNAAAWAGREDIDCRFMWPAAFGLMAREYDERHGLDRRHLNRIAEINYANARLNPLAQTRRWQFGPRSFTDCDESNPVIEPGTRRNDCAQITDGAASLILASAGFARDHARRTGVSLDALPRIVGWGHRNAGARLRDKFERSRGEPYLFPHMRHAIQDAWRRAGITGPEALDGIETHDCFAMTEYLAIDHFGITAPGRAFEAIESGSIERGGALPINPGGGLIGIGHPVGATGARMLLDAARQVSGRAGDIQIGGAKRFATLNIGGSCATVCSFVVATGES